MIRLVAALVAVLTTTACTHSYHLVHVGDFDPTYASYADGEWITAEAEQHVVLGFVKQTDYVERAFTKLKNACPGRVQGVQTEYSTDHGFLSWTNRIRMQGLCLKRS